jgi:hypothetical protein
MSTPSEPEFDLDLHFLPAWAQQSPELNRYAQFDGKDENRSGRRPDRGPQQRRDRPDKRAGRPAQSEKATPHPGQGPRREFGGPPRRESRGGGFGPRPADQRALEPDLPEINISFIPDEKGVDSLARQIKLTGRAYPLFGIAQMILKKPERQHVSFQVIKKPDGQVAQPLFLCALDDTLWLSEQDAVDHVFKRHFQTFYQTERTPTDPPKGTYTFVAQCGMSGSILGPPNYHDYQTKLLKLHAERFPRVPFEVFKSRVKIVRDESVVKQWLDEQSWKTEYVCLNVPEPKKLASREETEAHFRNTHLGNVIKPIESFTLSGLASRQLAEPPLRMAVRRALDEQMRFPLRIATVLSQQFAGRGLQFFKVNKTITHVAVARPHYLDLETTPVSDGVKRIMEFIDARPRCTRHQLVETLAPNPTTAVAPEPGARPVEGGQTKERPGQAVPTPAAPPTPEQTAVIADLHWLIHQGHVIEFASGILETAKKPVIRPFKAHEAPRPPAAVAEATAGEPLTDTHVSSESMPAHAPTEVASPLAGGIDAESKSEPGAAAPSDAQSNGAQETAPTAENAVSVPVGEPAEPQAAAPTHSATQPAAT